jgi:hypothetical protein
MAKNSNYVWSCDAPGCDNAYQTTELAAAYWDCPPDWAVVGVIETHGDESECACKCHEEEYDDEGDNLAGHEDYECEVCPDEDDNIWASTICPEHYAKFKLLNGLPRLRS